MPTPNATPIWALTGTPGSGKSTLATRLAARYRRPLVVTGGIARRIDPDAMARGELANQEAMRGALLEALAGWGFGTGVEGTPLIIDGWPRSAEQVGWIPEHAVEVFYLCCSPAIAVDRLLRRARADDQPELIQKRVQEQYNEMELWARQAAGWSRCLATGARTPQYIEQTFGLYLDGLRREVF